MRFMSLASTFAVSTLLVSVHAAAQTADASGHYQGIVSSPAGELALQVDLTRNAQGQVAGTLTIPAQKLKGFPLTNVAVNGRDVAFDVGTSGGGYFRGERNGSVIAGEFSTPMGAVPLDLERTGEPTVYGPPAGGRITREIEGTWNGTLEVDGGMRVVLKLASHPDGTSTGTLTSVDENNLVIPVGITQDGTNLTLDLPMVGSSYAGTVNAAGTELTGTYTTPRGLALPLSLKHATSN